MRLSLFQSFQSEQRDVVTLFHLTYKGCYVSFHRVDNLLAALSCSFLEGGSQTVVAELLVVFVHGLIHTVGEHHERLARF